MTRDLKYLVAYLLCRVLYRISTDSYSSRGISTGIEGHNIGIDSFRRVDDNICHSHAQDLCSHLCQQGVITCTGSAHQQIKRAVLIEFDTGCTHISAPRSDTMHRQGHSDTSTETTGIIPAAPLLPV